MSQRHLVLSLPQGTVTATSLGVDGLAWHRSPGTGPRFRDRKVLFDLVLDGGMAGFDYLDEGGWRDAAADTRSALEAVDRGKRTKTALSNNAFSCTPLHALRAAHVVKTGGEVLELQPSELAARFPAGARCDESMTPADIASEIGGRPPADREPRLYLVLCPVQLIILSNLSRVEYAWYATHCPGKIFRQVAFVELSVAHLALADLAARSLFDDARAELARTPAKKTKTIVTEDCINRVPFGAWRGYRGEDGGGLCVGDSAHALAWPFPVKIPSAWDRAVD